jgi:2-polyprenyl-3-methyl-5-hydroxy-6-metoxy-1,4-benzoquinol methylase
MPTSHGSVRAGRYGCRVEGAAVLPVFENPRPEVAAKVPAWARTILDLGCASGRLGLALQEAVPGRDITGVELDADLASVARRRLQHVVEADVEALVAARTDLGGPFDVIVAADILEHLRDPWAVVRWAADQLVPDGLFVASVPNVRHVQTLWALLVRKRWRYDGVGLFDRTHLRWFTRANLPELFHGTDLSVEEVDRVPMLSTQPTAWNRLAPLLGDLGAMQLLVVAQRGRR